MSRVSSACWICGDVATTGEHLIKKSDLKQIFGVPNSKAPLFLHSEDKSNLRIQGLSANALKIENTLCAKCNNQLTQPYDRAWERLSAFIQAHKKSIRPGSTIAANSVFATHSNQMMRNVQLFFIKLFGCLLVSNTIDLSLDSFASAVQAGNFHPDIFLKFGCVPRVEQIVGVAGLSVAKDSKGDIIVGAQWFYELEGIAVNVIYSPVHDLWADTEGAWHPAPKKGRILFHDFSSRMSEPAS